MITRAWKVYGPLGLEQEVSFEESMHYDWSAFEGETRVLEVINADKTGTNDYTILRITRDSYSKCADEFFGQLYDGVFENSHFGAVYEVDPETFEEVSEWKGR